MKKLVIWQKEAVLWRASNKLKGQRNSASREERLEAVDKTEPVRAATRLDSILLADLRVPNYPQLLNSRKRERREREGRPIEHSWRIKWIVGSKTSPGGKVFTREATQNRIVVHLPI